MGLAERLHTLLARSAKWVLALSGRDVIDSGKYGHDAFRDIERLSRAWHCPVAVFFDVGANDGGTVRAARQRFGTCRIIAFEPHPQIFLKLKENVGRFPNVELVNLALGPAPGEKTMFEYDLPVLNSLVSDAQYAVRFETKARRIDVSCTTLDRFCTEHGIRQVDVLKIDTEGFDLEVLKGAASMLERQAIRFIYVEFNDIHPHENASGGALAPIDQLVRPHGYRFIATYNDYVITDGELFAVSNALYALPRPSDRSWHDR